jgi:hypothetical protein
MYFLSLYLHERLLVGSVAGLRGTFERGPQAHGGVRLPLCCRS